MNTLQSISINQSPRYRMQIIPLQISNTDKENKVITFFPHGRVLINKPNKLNVKPLSLQYRWHKWKTFFHAFNANLITTINPFEAYAKAKWFVTQHLEYLEGLHLHEDESVVIDHCLYVDDPDESIDNVFLVPSQKYLREQFFNNNITFSEKIIMHEMSGLDQYYFLCVFKYFEI